MTLQSCCCLVSAVVGNRLLQLLAEMNIDHLDCMRGTRHLHAPVFFM